MKNEKSRIVSLQEIPIELKRSERQIFNGWYEKLGMEKSNYNDHIFYGVKCLMISMYAEDNGCLDPDGIVNERKMNKILRNVTKEELRDLYETETEFCD